MHLDIDGSSVVRHPSIRQHIEREIRRGLAPFEDRIGLVRLRMRERAPTEPVRMLCGIGVTLVPPEEALGAWVLARGEDDDAHRAVERAVARVARAVAEEINRRDRARDLRVRALRASAPAEGLVEPA